MSTQEADVYIGLLHHPIYNKKGEKITTTVTNLDLHDISRAGKTYDINRFYVINRLKSQQALIQRMKNYWTGGYGAEYNYNRHQAFSVLEISDSLDETIANIEQETGKKPLMVATDASEFPGFIDYKEMRGMLANSSRPFLLVFGTGWGLTEETLSRCDYILAPVYGRGDFNHLSVRSAVSIILDRLLASEWWS
ncbi:MAG: RNA methyltransferase [Halanaerobiales bacterium]